jgi:hypothetical protein
MPPGLDIVRLMQVSKGESWAKLTFAMEVNRTKGMVRQIASERQVLELDRATKRKVFMKLIFVVGCLRLAETLGIVK